MIRRLKLPFAVMVVLFTPAAFALGLGELDLQSALNQQFKAEIRLTNLRGLQIDEVLPNLASEADFDRVGVERSYLLTDLRFKVIQVDGGDLIVRVTSNKLIVEPFLNFIVEVLWPNGRILREYTVLLDPPIFGEDGVEAIIASEISVRKAIPKQPTQATKSRQSNTDPKPISSRQLVEATSQPSESQSDSPSAAREGEVKDDQYGMTGAGDTLWTIALKVRPNNSVSVQQTMLALQRANPDAFINNNINLLKAGHVLRLPGAREIKEGSIAAAVKEVRTQNEAFDAYKSGSKGSSVAQLDATRRNSNNDAGRQGTSSGELKLLASNESNGERAGEGSSARARDLENNLAVAGEDLDRARRANSEMNLRLDDLQGQLETLNEILTLKDDQLAALRAEIQRMQSNPAVTLSPTNTELASNPAGDSSLMTTIASIIGGVLVLMAAIGGLIFMRRRQQAKSLDDELVDESLEDELDAEESEPLPELDGDETEDTAEEEEVTQETNDVISEVEIYIAYGRFPQAITFLQNAIEAEPARSDVQLKLLEVFVQTEDAVAFNLQLEQLKRLGDDEATEAAMALQQKIPGAAEDAAASMDATIISSEPIIAIDEPEDDDDDLSFDLDDLDSETEDDDLNLSDELDLDLNDVELDLDADDDEILLALDDDEISLDLDDSDELLLDLDDDDEISLDLDDDEISLDLDDDEISLDLDDDEISLDLDDDEISLDTDDDELSLDLEGEDEISLDLDDDLSFDLEDDDEISLDLDDDELSLDLEGEDEITLDLDDDELSLDLEGEDEISLDLDDDELSLDLEGEDEVSSDLDDDELSLDLEGEDEISLDLDDDELSLDLEGEDEISLELDDDLSLDLEDEDELSLDLDDDGSFSLDLDDEDISLDVDDDEDNKLDLARAYIDMGDGEGARSVLNDVLTSGTDEEIKEANELLEKIV
jgi:pilus assembly protein FimV